MGKVNQLSSSCQKYFDKLKSYSQPLTRIGLSLVFLWFGVNQLFLPENFMGYLPSFLLALDQAKLIVQLNGLFEIIAGTLLLLGLLIRPVALVLGLHLLGIIVTLGYNDIAIRDLGLMIATFAIFLGGKDKWSLNKKK